MEYRPDMRIVIVNDDGVAEGMTRLFPVSMVLNGRKGIVGGIDGRYSKASTHPGLSTP